MGSHVPFHCTASGKCCMASLNPSARKRFVKSIALEALTDATITDEARLLEELSEIEERGYSLDQEEFIDGMVAIAVPVSDAQGRFLAALAFHGPTQRLSIDTIVEKLGLLQTTARQLHGAILDEDQPVYEDA